MGGREQLALLLPPPRPPNLLAPPPPPPGSAAINYCFQWNNPSHHVHHLPYHLLPGNVCKLAIPCRAEKP